MSTAWKSAAKATTEGNFGKEKLNNAHANHLSNSQPRLTSWTRQQRFAMLACFAILAVLLIVSACSKQSSKSALVAVSTPSSVALAPAVSPIDNSGTIAPVAVPAAKAKKAMKKRPPNVLYSDTYTGVSFLYPRKFMLESGDKAEAQFAAVGDVPMNFSEPGGNILATVEAPYNSYPGTDFRSAFFNVNLNRNLSADQCSHFAFTDTSNSDGEPVDAEKVNVGDSEMQTTSSYTALPDGHAQTRYYHQYKEGVCYEYVLGVGTEGFSTEGSVKHVNDDEVIARLEKILTTVKVTPPQPEPTSESVPTGMVGGKE
jgi:hypothetical protein